MSDNFDIFAMMEDMMQMPASTHSKDFYTKDVNSAVIFEMMRTTPHVKDTKNNAKFDNGTCSKMSSNK